MPTQERSLGTDIWKVTSQNSSRSPLPWPRADVTPKCPTPSFFAWPVLRTHWFQIVSVSATQSHKGTPLWLSLWPQLDGTVLPLSFLPLGWLALLLEHGNGAPVCCGSCTCQAIDHLIPSCAELRSPSLGLNLPLSYTNMVLAHFYCCKLFMRGMLNLETEV